MAAVPELTLVGLQVSAVTSMGATRVRLVDCVEAFKVAVTVALWVVVTAPALAVKVPEAAPAATVTDVGTVSTALLSERATTTPPVGAAWFKVAVQVVAVPEFTVVGLQASEETSTGATSVKLAVWEAPFKVAVTVADWVAVKVAAVAVKVAAVAPAATVTEAGTVSEGLLSERATTLPPVAAA